MGHAVNEKARSWCGVVGDSKSNVNVDDVELDRELPGDSLSSLREIVGQLATVWNLVRKLT